jgi:hypothetical protein
MNKMSLTVAGLVLAGAAFAENVIGVDRMICAPAQVQICIEFDTCYAVSAEELGIPDFVLIDTGEQTISTTPASGQSRSTPFTSYEREDGLIYLQGIEGGRAFSFVIEEITGSLTAAVSRDGIAVNVFGACTDADL